jgi:hypothetical protein
VVVKVEGPSDLLAVLSIGLPPGWVAITNACGAKSANPAKLDFGFAVGKRIIIVGDADKLGQEGARRFAEKFHQEGATEIRIVKLPYEVREDRGKDLRDWLNEGHGTEDFLRSIDAAQIVTADEVAAWAKPVHSDQQRRPTIVIVGDTGRRLCHVRFETSQENPEERRDFLHPNLLAWVRREQPRLAYAAATLLSAYFAAGRPDMGLVP